MSPVLQVNHAKKHYPVSISYKEKKLVKALDDISFELFKGETLAIVGESGCGKSTLAKFLMRLENPTAGQYQIQGRDAFNLAKKELYSKIQMVFQDPYGSLNPRKKIWQLVAEPLMVNTKLSKKECLSKAHEALEKVGLPSGYADRYPHMFSGGQRQRVGIARALIMDPEILILDEPVSALDVSVQAQVLNLLKDLQKELQLSYLFISHDLSVVKFLADRIMVLYLGKISEYGDAQTILNTPKHPYTQALLESSPDIFKQDHEFKFISGELPSPLTPPTGCPFQTRCPKVQNRCKKDFPKKTQCGDRVFFCDVV